MAEEIIGTIFAVLFTLVVAMFWVIVAKTSPMILIWIAVALLTAAAVWVDYKVIKYFIDKHKER